MKRIRILILRSALFLMFCSLLFAQQSIKNISFNFKDTSLKAALEYIVKESNGAVIYQQSQVQGMFVTSACSDCDLETALNNILQETPLTWHKVNNQLIVSPAQTTKQQELYNLHGFVIDKSTGEPIPYCNVWLDNTQLGAATDIDGYYKIKGVTKGSYKLVVMVLGYGQVEKEIHLNGQSIDRFDFEISPEVDETETIVVSGARTRFTEKIEVSTLNISPVEILTTPAFVEADVFRTIQQLPSVTSASDFSSALIVRGGSSDENLVLLDDAEIYNPFHLVGLFSTFNADAIANAEFMAGGYSADYTGRLSSILDITSREGNSRQGKFFKDKEFGKYWDLSRVKGEISLLSSRGLAEGPFYKGAWILTGRRTYFDLLADMAGKGDGWDYYFWDNQFKVFSDLDDQNRLTFSTFYGRDILNFKIEGDDALQSNVDFDWGWGNHSNTLSWRYIPSSRLYNDLTLTYSGFDFDILFSENDGAGGNRDVEFDISNQIRDFSLKEKLTWSATPEHTITTGLALKILAMQFDLGINGVQYFNIKQSPNIYSVFVQDKWKINEQLSLQAGLRGTKYEIHDKIYIDPRLGFKYMLNENLALKGNWGLYNQFLFTTNDEEEELLKIVDFWQPVPKNFDAISNQHYILGLEQWFEEGFTASVETYYKPYSNVLTNNPNNNPALDDDDFISGKGAAWGVELLFKKTKGDLTGWIGYSYTNIERRFDLNGDGVIRKSNNQLSEIYTPLYSKPHTFNMVTSYRLNESNVLSMSWTMASGQPYTPVVGKVFSEEEGSADPYGGLTNIYGKKNSSRYPTYIRGDISWIKDINWFGIDGKFKLQVINITNHYNVLTYIWNHNQSPSGVKAMSMFPIMPSLGLEFEF